MSRVKQNSEINDYYTIGRIKLNASSVFRRCRSMREYDKEIIIKRGREMLKLNQRVKKREQIMEDKDDG